MRYILKNIIEEDTSCYRKTSDKTYSPPGFKTFAAKIRWEGHTIITENMLLMQ